MTTPMIVSGTAPMIVSGTAPMIVSGGQTGVDRAALDAALEAGLACGGYCPRGRRAEDGPIDARYPLRETPSAEPAERTEWNVRESDATLVIAPGGPTGGTAFAVACARRLGRPLWIHDLEAGPLDGTALRAWLAREGVARLNVAGPRESEHPGITRRVRLELAALFVELAR
jgi:hypothetical protein